METHSGDSPINRFFSFWGAIFTFLTFGALLLLGVAFESSLLTGPSEDPDDQRRTELDSASLAEQALLVNAWKKNDDGTYEVPADVALGKMVDKFPKASKSSVPVPGTAAAEEAAAAAAAAAPAPAAGDAGDETQSETK